MQSANFAQYDLHTQLSIATTGALSGPSSLYEQALLDGNLLICHVTPPQTSGALHEVSNLHQLQKPFTKLQSR